MECEKGHLIKIPRKGELNELENHRGIKLLSVTGNVLNSVTQSAERLNERVISVA